MIRSLNTAVLGIKQFQTSLDAIGNNLANINTVGYKGARVDFSDTLAQTMRAPTPDTTGATSLFSRSRVLGARKASPGCYHRSTQSLGAVIAKWQTLTPGSNLVDC